MGWLFPFQLTNFAPSHSLFSAMPKFDIIKNGTNADLAEVVQARVHEYLHHICEPEELIQLDGVHSFTFGTVQINVKVIPWHTEDVLVSIYSYICEDVRLNEKLASELLRINATTPFGSFGITYDNCVVFNYAIPGANLDYKEFLACLQTVAALADSYDEKVLEMNTPDQAVGQAFDNLS